MKSLLAVICGWFFIFASLQAQEISCVLTPASSTPITNHVGLVWLACLNSSAEPVSHSFAASVDSVLNSGTNTFPVVLQLANKMSATVTIAAGEFARRPYRFTIPGGLEGHVMLQAKDLNPVILQVSNPPTSVAATPVVSPTAPAAPAPSTTATNVFFSSGISKFLGEHISPYEPIYFLLGTYPAAEFQFSLKYKLVDLDSTWNPLAHSYFAYTQTSFWDLFTRDPSFYDTSYKPSAFLFYPEVTAIKSLHLDLQGGVEHESNGRGGAEERALNTVYFQPTFRLQLPKSWTFSVQPRIWDYLSIGDNNKNLPDYRGYADVRCAISYWKNPTTKQFELATRLRLGDKGRHAGWLFDLRYNLPTSWKINPALDIQYFTGYGQTLRQYDQFSTGLRAGFCLWY